MFLETVLNLKTNLQERKDLGLKIQSVQLVKKSKELSGTEMPKWNQESERHLVFLPKRS